MYDDRNNLAHLLPPCIRCLKRSSTEAAGQLQYPCIRQAGIAVASRSFDAGRNPSVLNKRLCWLEQGDGGCKKTILRKGQGWETPEVGDDVTGVSQRMFLDRSLAASLQEQLQLLQIKD
jgi:hypothetical protein